MEIDAILQSIPTITFPIAACIVMWRQNSDLQSTLNKTTETMVSMTERLSQIEDKLDDKNNFSSIMTSVTERLTQIESRLSEK